ncbi:ATP-binding protein [Nonomuraea sp. SYSU D8015]|uniref:ATP-binding protein n=1 Tax=Nonomuraea sp. SYSU D8015 TaxID=2593644 RepID=UPI001CB6D388|nr:ATP-binding protein [Nonomuraea sp. SYSU D8015]
MSRTRTHVAHGLIELHTPPFASAPQQARDLALAATMAWGLPLPVDEVILVVGELVTNAVRWARTPIGVRLAMRQGVVRIEVADGDCRAPRMATPYGTDERHRGLIVVAALADRWGCERRRRGKVVWAEFDVATGAAAQSACPVAVDCAMAPRT